MGWPYTFATESGNQPAAQLDTMFNAVGLLTIVPCTAIGTNTIALTPQVNTPVQSAYANSQRYSFIAAATSTGSVTINVNSIGALPLYRWSVNTYTQAGAKDLIIGAYYDIVYNSSFNAGSGGFAIVSAVDITAMLDQIASTQGDILYRDGSVWAALTYGTSGQFLQTQGSGANPKWAAAPTAAVTQYYATAVPFTPLANSVTHSEAHGLTAPFDAWLLLTCTSADQGYSIGDIIKMAGGFAGSGNVGLTVWLNATNVGYSTMAGGTNAYYVAPKAGGAAQYLDTSKWTATLVVIG